MDRMVVGSNAAMNMTTSNLPSSVAGRCLGHRHFGVRTQHGHGIAISGSMLIMLAFIDVAP